MNFRNMTSRLGASSGYCFLVGGGHTVSLQSLCFVLVILYHLERVLSIDKLLKKYETGKYASIVSFGALKVYYSLVRF